jgi:hypothetical protein
MLCRSPDFKVKLEDATDLNRHVEYWAADVVDKIVQGRRCLYLLQSGHE